MGSWDPLSLSDLLGGPTGLSHLPLWFITVEGHGTISAVARGPSAQETGHQLPSVPSQRSHEAEPPSSACDAHGAPPALRHRTRAQA